MTVTRFDRGTVKGKAARTDEGYIAAQAIVTKTGVFAYKNADGTTRFELRHPDEVFLQASLDSMKMIPVTDGHPEGMVDASNAKDLQIGTVGETITPDGKDILATLRITHEDAIGSIDNGRIELSLGYTTKLVREDGEYNGQRYTHRQTDIRYNHLSLVDRARVGASARLNLDSDAAQQATTENIPMPDENLVTVTLDGGLTYKASPEVSKALTDATARAAAADEALATAKADAAKEKARADTAEESLEAAKKVDHAAEVDKAVKDRMDLERVAIKAFDGDDDKIAKVADMASLDLKKAVIVHVQPAASDKMDDADEAYINARFDGAIESLPDGGAIARQREAAIPNRDSKTNTDGRAKADESMQALKDMHKPGKEEAA